MQPKAKEFPETKRETWNRPFRGNLRESTALPTAWSWTSALPNCALGTWLVILRKQIQCLQLLGFVDLGKCPHWDVDRAGHSPCGGRFGQRGLPPEEKPGSADSHHQGLAGGLLFPPFLLAPLRRQGSCLTLKGTPDFFKGHRNISNQGMRESTH